MGASGAGKTSLLNLLSCRIQNGGNTKIEGKYMVNQKSYTSGEFSKFAAYVMQNDIMMETMTPREALTFAAELRLSESKEVKKEKV